MKERSKRVRRRPRDRVAAPTQAIDTDPNWGAALDILITSTASFLLSSGVSKKQVAHELRKAVERLETNRASQQRSGSYELMVRVSGLVHDWCWDSRYVDAKTGKPAALRLEHAHGSLRELIEKRFPDVSFREVLSWMELNAVIARQLDGSFVLTRPSVLIGDSHPLALERIATLAAQFLEVSTANLRTQDVSQRNLDRTARVFNLPEKYLPWFREVVREQAQSFLETIDNWLESRNAPNSRQATVEAGVHTYAYTGVARSAERRMTPRTKMRRAARSLR